MSLLELSGVEKSFGAVQVLHGVDLSVDAGEVIGLVGDNGAGKSTLMKTITGVYTTDKGRITFNGEDVTSRTPGERRSSGIEMIYQDLALAPQQDVANNIFLGREPTKRFLGVLPGFVDKSRIDLEAQEMVDRLGVHVPSIDIPVGMLSGGQQQTIAIARALTFKPKLVIMDEPTAALAVREVESVLNLIRQMRDEGITTILISHRLNDVFEACGRIVVLRRGNVIADLKRDETDMAEVVSYIVGAHG
ncbi:ATP-binding cassette domain-containing protein [Roseibium sp. MMSF_3544]|uniref:ATP-binding cassette domain-containing protein n=1 Tax=unclassified Roseibium TaxID=2629323 RepID=UPI00273F2E95|nr:ATP-binding cassette domain-containing protein [Roseibium sp. MMSF_3544]